ncbi:MAG: tripartite tricarboxylate transporter substrate binding protein [Betaproteobacteria bacterium]|nr:tripartite tricarboxylate transporter substrate binding protein [Betaproteobacteria bacterium]
MVRCWKCTIVALAAAALNGFFSGQVLAAYPAKPIRFVVPWPPGGGADIMSRLINQPLGEALGQQVIIDNRGGAAGNIGAELAAKSPPDGHAIVFAYSGTHSINPHIYRKMPFKQSDLAPVIQLAAVPQVVVVHPSLPVKSLRDLIAVVKARPGQLTYASSGNGAINHLAGELFKMRTGTDIVHVPYKGAAPSIIGLLSGEVHLLFASIPSALSQIRSGRVRTLAVSTAQRNPTLPDVPTLSEAGVPGYDAASWYGLFAPAEVPKPGARPARTGARARHGRE